MPKLTKLQYFVLAILVALIGSISFNINIYIEKRLSAEYDRGLTQGKDEGLIQGRAEVWSNLSSQFQKLGRLELPAKTPDGTDGTIIFIPQVPKVETTTINNK